MNSLILYALKAPSQKAMVHQGTHRCWFSGIAFGNGNIIFESTLSTYLVSSIHMGIVSYRHTHSSGSPLTNCGLSLSKYKFFFCIYHSYDKPCRLNTYKCHSVWDASILSFMICSYTILTIVSDLQLSVHAINLFVTAWPQYVGVA